MVVALLLGPPANMFGNVGPVAEAVHLGALEQEQLLVGAPVAVEDGERVRRDDAVGVRRAMWTEGFAVEKAL